MKSLGLLLLVVACAPAQTLRPGEWVRDSDAVFPDTAPVDSAGRALVAVTRVLDEVTGHPIPGATMHALIESEHPVSGEFEPEKSATADELGWVRIPLGELTGKVNWFFFDAPGHAARAEFGSTVDEVTSLRPGVSLPVLVRDAMGRPAADAGVGLILGCGHTPDVRSARTDSRGRAVLPECDPGKGQLWIVEPGLRADYVDVDWAPGEPPVTIWADPGPVVEGTVVDHLGRPVQGAYVGAVRCHRGPWCRTGSDGRFVLCGADRGYLLQVQHPAWGTDTVLRAEVPPPGFPITLTLPPPGSPCKEIEGDISLPVTVRDASGAPMEDVYVVAVREQDGFTVSGGTDGDGRTVLWMLPGSATVFVGQPLGRFGQERLKVEVQGEAHEPLQVTLKPLLRRRAVLKGFPAEGHVHLVSDAAVREVGEELRSSGAVAVPRAGELALRLSDGGRVKIVPLEVEPHAEEAPPLVIDWFPPMTVTASLQDEAGRPIQGSLVVTKDADLRQKEIEAARKASPAEGRQSAQVASVGAWYLHAVPRDEKLAPAARAFRVSGSGSQPLDLGALTCRPRAEARLRVEQPDGTPASGASVHVRQRGGAMQSWFLLDEQGSARSLMMDVRAGALVRIVSARDDALRPLVVRLEGEGPWVLRWPRSALELRVLDAGGEALASFSVMLDGDVLTGEDGRLSVTGLESVERTLVVTAPGHRARLVHLLPHEGSRSLEIRLSPRVR